ncbi:MAG: GNAT family N-acetyltransferase [Bacteroidia bacterium]|nr:GNAT family N-acetyltransferase [Bacteroidia bacterium]
MEFIPISNRPEQLKDFEKNPEARAIFNFTQSYYQQIGFTPPWHGYFAKLDGILVGTAAFKGKPKDNQIEIAYGTFESHRQKGVASEMCRKLLELALQSDPGLRITARTLMEENASTKILRKNGFQFVGSVIDPDDGEVWEWVYSP